MIKVIACTCGGVERLARATLMKGGMTDHMNVPITRGKNKSIAVLNALPEVYRNTSDFKALEAHVQNSGRFVIIIGYANGGLKWMDIARGTIKEKLDAELIVEHYKDLTD